MKAIRGRTRRLTFLPKAQDHESVVLLYAAQWSDSSDQNDHGGPAGCRPVQRQGGYCGGEEEEGGRGPGRRCPGEGGSHSTRPADGEPAELPAEDEDGPGDGGPARRTARRPPAPGGCGGGTVQGAGLPGD